MLSAAHFLRWLSILLLCWAASGAWAQSFRVQCPNSTTLHPNDTTNTAPGTSGAIEIGGMTFRR